MKKNRHSPEQIIRLLREQESSLKTVAEFCRENGFAEQTFYRWRRQYGGMEEGQAKRLRELETENARLKYLLAEKELALELIRGKFPKNSLAPRNGGRL
jgi:putative transposase